MIPMGLIQHRKLYSITSKFPKETQPPTIRPLRENLMRKLAFQVEHLMTIMQAQLADKNEDEKLEIITMICEIYIKEINQTYYRSKNTKTNQTVTVIVETEICKQIIQVFIIKKSLGWNLFYLE